MANFGKLGSRLIFSRTCLCTPRSPGTGKRNHRERMSRGEDGRAKGSWTESVNPIYRSYKCESVIIYSYS